MVAKSKIFYEVISAKLDKSERIIKLSKYSGDAVSEAQLSH